MNVLLLYLQELLNLQTHGGRGERDRGQAGDRDGGRRQYRDQAEGAQVRGEADSERRLDLSQAMKRR